MAACPRTPPDDEGCPGPREGTGDSDITPAVLAIGRPSFPQALIGALRRVAGVGHCMVFTFEGERSARCLLDIG
jgi:hypothetical protein